jgi:lysozyme family protein
MHRLSRILGSLILVLLGLVFLTCIASADDLQTRRWAAAIVEPRRAREASLICDRILARQNRYQSVQRATWVPWHVIAGLHNMEASGSFNCHLHEGSPLTARTRYVPKGRPLAGKPPFTWEESAVDALLYDRMDCVDWQHIGTSLEACERYNGTGYLRHHPETPTPYLWAGTSIERPGKYVADGVWSSTARSSQIGIAAIWKTLIARGMIRSPGM